MSHVYQHILLGCRKIVVILYSFSRRPGVIAKVIAAGEGMIFIGKRLFALVLGCLRNVAISDSQVKGMQ